MSTTLSLPETPRRLAPLLAGARLDHVAMVVRNREKSIAALSALVAGPFDRFEYTNTAIVLGERSTYTLHMALAPLSPTMDLEIIELHAGRNALHEQFLRERGEGLQHLAYEVDDFEGSIAAFRAAGYAPLLQKDGGTPVAIYLDTRADCGFFTELIRKGFRMRDPATWPK
jgi:catechol 2,3-dioxygenase-like lactoylglutathione lyase family enzyme